MRRRILLVTGAALAVLLVVLAVEVQLARLRPRLDDEVGERPRDLRVGDGGGDPFVTVWFGDSTTTAVGADFEDGVAFGVAEYDAARTGRPVSLSVFGVSGDEVGQVVSGQIPEFVASGIEPDRVYISIGGNDVTHLTRRPAFRSRYRAMLDAVVDAAPDAEIVVLGVPDMGSVIRFDQPLRLIASWRGTALADDARNAAAEYGLHFVEIARRTGPPFRRHPDRYFAADDFHPSAAGYGVWTEAVIDSLEGR